MRLLESFDLPIGGVRFLVTILPTEVDPSNTAIHASSEESDLATANATLLKKLWDAEEEDHGWTGL